MATDLSDRDGVPQFAAPSGFYSSPPTPEYFGSSPNPSLGPSAGVAAYGVSAQ